MTTEDNSLRNKSRAHANDGGSRTSDGWKKFDIDGVLVASEHGLPP